MTRSAPSFPLRPPARWTLVVGSLVAVVLTLMVVGRGFGAPATVGPGTTEQGQGADVGEQTPTWWAWEATQIWGMPSPVPAGASSAPSTPTVLPSSFSPYRINAATAGNTSVRWAFGETTAAPASTELELRFSDGLTRAAVSIIVYLETQAAAPVAGLTFYLYWDAGAFGPSGVTVESLHVTVLVCTAIGRCP